RPAAQCCAPGLRRDPRHLHPNAPGSTGIEILVLTWRRARGRNHATVYPGTIAGLLFLTFTSAPTGAEWLYRARRRNLRREREVLTTLKITNGAFTLENRDHSFFWTRKSGS